MSTTCALVQTTTVLLIMTSLAASAPKQGVAVPDKQLVRIPKQIQLQPTVVNTEQDHQSDETGGHHLFGGGGGGGGGIGLSAGHGKYFQYQHVPQKDHYEFGYKRGNSHHFTERHEKAAPHHGIFKTKARWGDKHGGYGEHYWDYNHAGHDHGGGGGGGANDEESHDEDEGDGGYSHHVPEYLTPLETDSSDMMSHHSPAKGSPAPTSDERVKRQPGQATVSPQKQLSSAASLSPEGPISLIYDVDSGTVVNEATGQSYILHPVN